MSSPSINVEEFAALQALAARGPARHLSSRLQGRLALYRLIDEGPDGWAITGHGRRVLARARPEALSPEQLLFVAGPPLASANELDFVTDESPSAEADDDPPGTAEAAADTGSTAFSLPVANTTWSPPDSAQAATAP